MRELRLIACFLIGSTCGYATGQEIPHAQTSFSALLLESPFPASDQFTGGTAGADPIPGIDPRIDPLPEPDVLIPPVPLSGPLQATPFPLDEEGIPAGSPQASSGQPSISTVESSAETLIDLRPPKFSVDTPWIEAEPSWLNEVIDDHILIWQSVTDGIITVPRGNTDFGITTLGTKFEISNGEGPFWVQGFFGWNFLSGPSTVAVDAQTYDLGVEFNYSKQISDKIGLALSVSPMYATDFDNRTSEAFRLTAGGLISFQADSVTRFVAGLTYLDRPDLPFIPIAGLKWMVTDNLEMDILVPRPKVAWRFDQSEDREAWLYTAGEVGGGSWAIQRENDVDDRLGYRDLRWVCGVESRQVSGSRRVLEAGYVFDRKLSLEKGGGEQLKNSFVFRWGRLY